MNCTLYDLSSRVGVIAREIGALRDDIAVVTAQSSDRPLVADALRCLAHALDGQDHELSAHAMRLANLARVPGPLPCREAA